MQNPIFMEDHFDPGFKTKPAVHVGSQTHRIFHGIPKEQAVEGFHLAGSSANDVVVVRNMDPFYLQYWNSLIGKIHVVNLLGADTGKYLTEVILEKPEIIKKIKNIMAPDSQLMVFLPTLYEQELAYKLGIQLHGDATFSSQHGTKSGIRRISDEVDILPMSPGFICSTYQEISKAVNSLMEDFDQVIIKHDDSLSGYLSKKIKREDRRNLKAFLPEIVGGEFVDGKDTVVVEGWIKSKGALCVHIEILEGKEPIICAAWQQIIDSDGISYIGGGPLMLSSKALASLKNAALRLALILKQKGARGSFAPDFLITADDESHFEPDTCVLIELNGRVPYTAFPLEIIKQVKGQIGEGFQAQHIKVSPSISFKEITEILLNKRLLITGKDSNARGVVPFNIGLLPWGLFDVVGMADSWEQTVALMDEVKEIFKKKNT